MNTQVPWHTLSTSQQPTVGLCNADLYFADCGDLMAPISISVWHVIPTVFCASGQLGFRVVIFMAVEIEKWFKRQAVTL